ncbi:hypothetical protein WJX73_001871 [Symbiochloris irregularis]|uniref:RNA methyltransferase n=1 Tax=Symbiochloris irregularis TaxID=706552 RepID=A0AAW1PBW9_9CHLO
MSPFPGTIGFQQLQCSRLAVGGQGVCLSASGEELLVDRCLPGELLTAELKVSKKGLAAAQKLQQLTQKQLQIEETFCQPAGLNLPSLQIEQIEPCGYHYGYRNKMTFTSNMQGFGLYHFASGSGLVPVTDCHLQDSTANLLLQQAQQLQLHTFTEALTIRWADLNSSGPRHYMIIAHIRAAAKLWKKKREAVTARLSKVAKHLMAQQPALVSFAARQGATRHDCLTSSAGEFVVAGQAHLRQHLCGLNFIVSPASFMQTNPAQAEALYGMVLKAADLQPTDTVLDLFCGAGAISLVLAQHCQSRPDIDVVVADPARAGMGTHLLQFLQDCKARKIVYVSCNPQTQARDVQELCRRGNYAVKAVQPCDMFPHTAHVECIVTLQI